MKTFQMMTLALLLGRLRLPAAAADLGLDASAYGIVISAIIFVIGSLAVPDQPQTPTTGETRV